MTTFEWIVRPEWRSDGTVPFVITIKGERAKEIAAQIVADHRSAAAVPKLKDALTTLIEYAAGLELMLFANDIAFNDAGQLDAARKAIDEALTTVQGKKSCES
jgi:hypothetical protein